MLPYLTTSTHGHTKAARSSSAATSIPPTSQPRGAAKENAKSSGFLPEERAWLDRWQAHGWVDTFRLCHPDAVGAYTWWDLRTGAWARNVGWRLDYSFVHERLTERVKDAGIAAEVMGSDHCPVWLELLEEGA
jgi:exodeoxyribonuclease III